MVPFRPPPQAHLLPTCPSAPAHAGPVRSTIIAPNWEQTGLAQSTIISTKITHIHPYGVGRRPLVIGYRRTSGNVTSSNGHRKLRLLGRRPSRSSQQEKERRKGGKVRRARRLPSPHQQTPADPPPIPFPPVWLGRLEYLSLSSRQGPTWCHLLTHDSGLLPLWRPLVLAKQKNTERESEAKRSLFAYPHRFEFGRVMILRWEIAITRVYRCPGY